MIYRLPPLEDSVDQGAEFGLPESIIDLRQLHTVRLDLLTELCQHGRRRACIQPLCREHLAKPFADSYNRMGVASNVGEVNPLA